MSQHCVYYWKEIHINSASKLHDGYAQENEKNENVPLKHQNCSLK